MVAEFVSSNEETWSQLQEPARPSSEPPVSLLRLLAALDLHRRKALAQDAAEQERVQRLIDATDRQIDALVYALYDLTPEEIAVVEGAR